MLVFTQCMCDLYLPNLMSDIVNKGITNGDVGYILDKGVMMLLIALLGATCAVVSSYLSAHTAMGFGEMLRADIFTKVSTFSLNEFDRFGTPSLVTRSTNDVTQIQNVIVMIFRMLLAAPITAVGGMILALQKDAGLAWIIFIAMPVLGTVVGVIAGQGFPLFKSIQKKIDRMNLILRENLIGIRVIRAFNRGDYEKDRFTEANRDLMATSVKVNRLFAIMMPLMTLLMNVITISIL